MVFISPKEVVFLSSADRLLPLEILPFLPLTGEINASLSAKPAVTFPEKEGKQDSTDVPQDPPRVASIPLIRLKVKQAHIRERGSVSMRRGATLQKSLVC